MIQVPFFRPDIGQAEIDEVVDTLKSGWLTTGRKTQQFEAEVASLVGAKHAVALNSATAALHLALEALGIREGDVVLVPAMTFAATAEVVRYFGAFPLLVDCDRRTTNMDLGDARRKLVQLREGRQRGVAPDAPVVGVIPVHVGGLMMNMDEVEAFAREFGLWVVEDAAHALPAAWRRDADSPWIMCGSGTADVTCFSFYANKTITTGEGGMALTMRDDLASRMRLMSLHGLSHDAWKRYSGGRTWDYRIIAPGFKYNLTDVASSIGLHQLAKAEAMRVRREEVALEYLAAFRDIEELELPATDENRIHSWHLFPVRLRLDLLSIDRNRFIDELKDRGIGCSVHWRPLHLHPYYEQTFGWAAEDCPVASEEWERLVSLPLFSAMTTEEIDSVINVVRELCSRYTRVGAVQTSS